MRRYPLMYVALSLLSLPVTAETETPVEAVKEEVPAPKAVVVRPAQAQRSDLMAQSLKERLPAGELQELSTSHGNFLALWQSAQTPTAKGVVILLPDAFQHADQPGVIQPLRKHLPSYGWSTLSVMLPDPFDPLPKRPAVPALVKVEPQQEPDESIPSPATDEETAPAPIEQVQQTLEQEPTDVPIAPLAERIDSYTEQVFERIDAALAFAKAQKAQEIILLGQGNGAYWSARYTQNRTPKDVTRLIWIDAKAPQAMSPALETVFVELKMPIADISLSPTQHTRHAQATRQGLNHYRALHLQNLPDAHANQAQLVRRVRGWLDPKP